jgi:hypothetical protein
MSILRRVKDAIQGNQRLRRLIHDPYLAARFALPTAFRREWTARIADVLACPDLNDIPRVPDAGEVRRGVQFMHNGLRVVAGGYYGYPITRMMKLSRGVHEPQEEKAFAAVLPFIPRGGVMLELGAYWGFYSMWFNQRVADARNFLVEPLATNLEVGRENFRLNNMTGTFRQAFIGSTRGPSVCCVDQIVAEEKVDFLHMLHADVQGFEHEMLLGARKTLADRRVGYVFISTHSAELHATCADVLRSHDLKILADATPAQSYSFDGLLVARSPAVAGPERIEIAHKA